MDLSQLTTKQLKQRVKTRDAWLRKVIDFVEEVTREHGKRLSRHVHSCYVRSTHTLEDVQGFSFFIDGSYTMYGGDGVKIWYQPPSEKNAQKQEVLYLEYWEDVHVRLCVDEEKWVGPLKRLMRNKKNVFSTPAQKEKQEEKTEKKAVDRRHEEIRRAELLKKASQMRL